MSRSGIFILLWSLMGCSFGFTADRSALVPSAWDTAPSLDTYQRIFVDPALKNEMQMKSTNKVSQAEDAKISKNMPGNQTREKRLTTENIKTEMKLIEIKPINEIVSTMKNGASDSSEENASSVITPRNVILLLIDERNQDKKRDENSWKDYKEKLPFAIEGFLQSCQVESANFSMDNTSISEKKERSDNCEYLLRSNIGELLSWARKVRGMTTGEVSGSNFSIPFFPGYEPSRFNESNAKLEPRKSKRDSNNGWQVIDLNDRAKSISPLSILTTANPKAGGETNYDITWDIFDVFSKIGMGFFRSLIESLRRNDGALKDEFSLRKSNSFKPTATDLIENTIRELKSVPNDKGFMLIAVAPRSEGAAVIDLFQRETSPKDTLLIVTQICDGNQRSIPFIAQGPNYRILLEARIINEFPITIKKAMITRDCHDTECTNRQKRDIPIVSTGKIFSQELPVEKRVIRNNNAEKPSTEKTIGKEVQATSSTSLKTIPFGLATMLCVTTSIFTKVTMTSS